jgi:hypothetical protein
MQFSVTNMLEHSLWRIASPACFEAAAAAAAAAAARAIQLCIIFERSILADREHPF